MTRARVLSGFGKRCIGVTVGCALWTLLWASSGLCQTAQEAHVSGSPNPVGSGARALGMGGAFIGVADDATAASWNPGGLIQLETPEMSMVLSYDKRFEKRSFRDNPGASGKQDISLYDINYLSAAYPFQYKQHNMIVSLNYQTLYDFNKSNAYSYHFDRETETSEINDNPLTRLLIETSTRMHGPRETNLSTDGYLKALTPAFAAQITPSLSVGVAMNWFHPELGSSWETHYVDHFDGFFDTTTDITVNFKTFPIPPVQLTNTARYKMHQETHYYDKFEFRTSVNPLDLSGRKVSYNLGFLWNIGSMFTLGGVYKAGYKARVKYKEVFSTSQYMVNTADPTDETRTDTGLVVIADEKQFLEMPQSYGLGLACRFSDQFTMDLDVYRTDWQHFVLEQADGRELSLITGEERTKADTEPTHQVRLGAEYLFFVKNRYVVPLRGGVFYDPEPTEGEPDDFYGFSLGGGFASGSWVFDMAYQYRWGKDVRMVRLSGEERLQDVDQHTVYTSLIYHF